MKTIYNKFDKKRINDLPQVLFPGKIIVIQSESEADKAVDYLLKADILGVDTETRPIFKKGAMRKVALLQVSTIDICFLFRLNFIDMPPSVIRLLSNTDVPMIGLSWHDDICQLHRRSDFTPGLFIDIQDIVGRIGIKDLSLQKLYANIFGQKISKRQRLTNWEADVLTTQQKAYAATDAWACINLYTEIMRLEASHDYQLEIVPEPVVETAATQNQLESENGKTEPVDEKEGDRKQKKKVKAPKGKASGKATKGKKKAKTSKEPKNKKKAEGLKEEKSLAKTEEGTKEMPGNAKKRVKAKSSTPKRKGKASFPDAPIDAAEPEK